MVNRLLEYTDDTFRKEINTILTQVHPNPITMKVVIGQLEEKLEIDLKDEGIRMHVRKLVMQCMDNKIPPENPNDTHVHTFFLK